MSLKKYKLRKFQFRWRIWPTWYCWLVSCLEENVNFDNFLITYIGNVLTFRLYFRNKLSIFNVFNMLFTYIWYSFSWIYVNGHFLKNNIKWYHFYTKNLWKSIKYGFKCIYFLEIFTILSRKCLVLSIKMSYFKLKNCKMYMFFIITCF